MPTALAAALLLSLAATPDDGLARTPPASWVRAGYQQLRWGMGPGDVKDALAAGGKVLKLAAPFELGAGYDPQGEGGARVAAPELVVAGLGSVLGFRFFKGRLVAVALLPADGPADPDAWEATIRGLLVERYGPPAATVDSRTLWHKDGLDVALPFLPGWTSSIGWFASHLTDAGPDAGPSGAGAPSGPPSPAELAEQTARQAAEKKAAEAARKAEEAARKAKAEAEKASEAARKAEASKL
jgi:hypothetical protein